MYFVQNSVVNGFQFNGISTIKPNGCISFRFSFSLIKRHNPRRKFRHTLSQLLWFQYLDIRPEAEHGSSGAFECLEGEGQEYPAFGIGWVGLLDQGLNSLAQYLGEDGNKVGGYTHGYRVLGPAGFEFGAPVRPKGRQVKTFRALARFFHYCCRLYPRNSQDSHSTLHRSHQVPDTGFGNQSQWVSYALDDFSVGFAIR